MMKKLLTCLILLFPVYGFTAGTESVIKAHEQGPKNSATLTNLLANIATDRAVRIDIDAGVWTITNNVTFGTNISLLVYPGSVFDVAAGSTVTVDGVLISRGWEIIRGAGVGTGNATFIYEFSEWGTGTVDFGEGRLGEEWATNNMQRWITNAYSNIDTSGADSVSFSDVAQSYISGAFPYYVDTNTVSITNGDGYCNSNYFTITNSISIDLTMTDFSSSTGFVYVYIDDSTSTYPSTISVFDTTNVPTLTTQPRGWYCSTSLNDRVLGAMYITNGVIARFDMTTAGAYYNYVLVLLGVAMNPDGKWQTPNTLESSVACPVNTSEILIEVASTDANANCKGTATTAETVTNGQAAANSTFPWHATAYNRIEHIDWLSLGPSRNILIRAEDDDDDGGFSCNLTGYRLMR